MSELSQFHIQRDVACLLLQADLPVLLWSPPGEGKTSFWEATCPQLGFTPYVIIGSLREPQDFIGIPVLTEHGFVRMAPPELAQHLAVPNTVLIVDELTTCPPQVQAALLRISHERWMGDTKLACRIVAAANPPGEAVAGMDIYGATANRYIHINWQMEATDYALGMKTDWAYTPPTLPDHWHHGIQEARNKVTDFLLNFQPMLLHHPAAEGEYAIATPRSWDFAARYMAAVKAAGASSDHLLLGLRGAIGSGPATELTAWLSLNSSTISIQDLINDPAGVINEILKAEPSVQAALYNGVADMLKGSKIDEKRFHTIMQNAIGKGVAGGILMATLSRVRDSLSRERYVSIERAIRKATEAWEGAGTKR